MLTQIRYWFGIACGVLAGGLFLTDCFGGNTEHVAGRLESKSYHAPYTTTTTYVDQKTHVPHTSTTYHPAEYWLYIRSWEELASVSTTEWKYYPLHEGQTLTYSRQRTRWTDYTWGDSY